MIYDLLIVGGGAAGMAAAVFAAQNGLKTAILERLPRVGKKLLSTGSGTCNITNLSVTADNYHSLSGSAESFVKPALNAFTAEDALEFFRSAGVETEPDGRGRIYPVCRSAAAVLDCLRMAYLSLGADEITNFDAVSVKKSGGVFTVLSKDGRASDGKALLISAGGAASPSLGGRERAYGFLENVKSTKQFPSLCPIKTDTEYIRAVKGLRVNARLRILQNKKTLAQSVDELQFVEQGLSGPAALAVSRAVSVNGGELTASVDLLFGRDAKALIYKRRDLDRPADELLTGLFQRRIGQTLLRYAGINTQNRRCADLTDGELDSIVFAASDFRTRVLGVTGMKDAQVTAGGVELCEVNKDTLMLDRHKGVFIAGEATDIDGDCGGYNLQWAWSSAFLAVKSAAEYIKSL